ncbi:MAG: HAMP domain-containing histidine kinase [Bacteroidales bacterium]|nr:HAMP domain-containing histidine kinase [Bacteroidales bacterium]
MFSELNIYTQKVRWKFLLFIFAVFIGISSLWYTNILVKKLAAEEKKRIELWAEAQENVIKTDENLEFYFKVLKNNETIPVIVVDSVSDSIQFHRNLNPKKVDNQKYIRRRLEKMKNENEPFNIYISENDHQLLYYGRSTIIEKLTYYPYVQLGIILLFIVVSYFAFSTARKTEQNKVWVGLSKETAHQLGTPISSLLALLEIMKLRESDNEMLLELEKDIRRLEKITERFSKIGSKPVLNKENIHEVIERAIRYLKTRSSEKVKYQLQAPPYELTTAINAELFEWVIENVCKNAIDAIDGDGTIEINITDHTQVVYIDISDTGRGIPKSKFKTIFKPGYTTKERGWGLGLSLSKRIVEEYHDGKIFVNESELGVGTKIRIVLKKDVK